MAELNQQQVVDYIKGISVLELSQLVKALEAELGVSAAAAMPMTHGRISTVSKPDWTAGSRAANAASSSSGTPFCAIIMPPPSSSTKGPPSRSLPVSSIVR